MPYRFSSGTGTPCRTAPAVRASSTSAFSEIQYIERGLAGEYPVENGEARLAFWRALVDTLPTGQYIQGARYSTSSATDASTQVSKSARYTALRVCPTISLFRRVFPL